MVYHQILIPDNDYTKDVPNLANFIQNMKHLPNIPLAVDMCLGTEGIPCCGT